MIFVTGGEFSGKSEYVKEQFGARITDGAKASLEELKCAEAVNNFHIFVKNAVREQRDIYSELDAILAENPDIVIISNEIGCGVVPVDKFYREYRETAGRVSCSLAGRAKRVIRVVCGIGQELK